MASSWRSLAFGFLLAVLVTAPLGAVELKVSRDALQRTLKQQLFSGPDGRYYLKGDAKSPCYVYADDAQITFQHDRVVVLINSHAKLGKAWGSRCIGIGLDTEPQVSLAPIGEGEIIGFRDARLEKISGQKELDIFISPFLSKQLPKSMQVNAADLLRKALEGSTASSGFKVTLDRLKIHSMMIEGDGLVMDFDGDLSVK